MNNNQILIVDDHPIFRYGLCRLLFDANPNVQVYEAESLESAMALGISQPDLILLGIKLPGVSGWAGIPLLKQRWAGVTIVMLSAIDAPEAVTEALACGAAGFISKKASPEFALHLIADAALLNASLFRPLPQSRHLTPRQQGVLDLLAQGLSNKRIARHLAVSENTVRRHVHDILEYFQVVSRSEAVNVAQRRGLI